MSVDLSPGKQTFLPWDSQCMSTCIVLNTPYSLQILGAPETVLMICCVFNLQYPAPFIHRPYRRFRPSPSRHDVVSNARLLLGPPADKLSLEQTEFSMVGIWGITLRKFLKCSVGFSEFSCTMVRDYRAIWLVELAFIWVLTPGFFKFPGGNLQFLGGKTCLE